MRIPHAIRACALAVVLATGTGCGDKKMRARVAAMDDKTLVEIQNNYPYGSKSAVIIADELRQRQVAQQKNEEQRTEQAKATERKRIEQEKIERAKAAEVAKGEQEAQKRELVHALKPVVDYYAQLRMAIKGLWEGEAPTAEDAAALALRIRTRKVEIEAKFGKTAGLSEPLRAILQPLQEDAANLLVVRQEFDKRDQFTRMRGGKDSVFSLFPCTRRAVVSGDPDASGDVTVDGRKASVLLGEQADAILKEAIAAYEKLSGQQFEQRAGKDEVRRDDAERAKRQQISAQRESAYQEYAARLRPLLMAEAQATRRFEEEVAMGKSLFAKGELAYKMGQSMEVQRYYDQGDICTKNAQGLAAQRQQYVHARLALKTENPQTYDVVVREFANDRSQSEYVRDYCRGILRGL